MADIALPTTAPLRAQWLCWIPVWGTVMWPHETRANGPETLRTDSQGCTAVRS